MADVVEVTVNEDGTTTEMERDFTPEERAIREADESASQVAEQARLEAEAKREAAIDKLAALGLTRDDLTALGL